MPASARSLGPFYGLAAAAGLLLGCSLALDFTECTADADCTTISDGNGTCENGKCVPPSGNPDPSSTGEPPDPTTGPVPGTSSGDDTTTTDDGTTTTGLTATTTGTSDTGDTDTDTGALTCTLNTECESGARQRPPLHRGQPASAR
jgi:hypothetical protein